MFSASDFVKLCAVFIGLFQLTQAAFLRCYNGSLDNYISTPLHQPLAITSCINKALPTVIYTFGYHGLVGGPATTAVLSAYITKQKRNVILVDWEKEAYNSLLGISLGYALYAVPNAITIGRELGEALLKFSEAGMDISQMHLIGHSLGAHLMGYAGKRTRKNGKVVPRITGLDPARALFEGSLTIYGGLDRTCAKFVDILHSNPGGYGLNNSYGTVDFWPNFSTEDKQPGCPSGDFDTFSHEDLCSHDRAWRYFIEALASPTAFQAARKESYEDWIGESGKAYQYIYIGDLTNTRAKGNFFLRTDSKSPYGLGEKGTRPVHESRKVRTASRSWFRLFAL